MSATDTVFGVGLLCMSPSPFAIDIGIENIEILMY